MKALVFDPPRAAWPLAKIATAFSPRAATGPLGGLRLRDVSEPTLPGPQWVRLRTLLGGICGSDVALVTLRNHPATILQRLTSFPAVLGHECVAVIEQVGPGVQNWKPGQRVCVDPCLSCVPRGIAPLCPQCAAGRPSLCDNTDRGDLPPGMIIGLNSRTGGSWSRLFVAHQSQLFAVPEAVPDAVAVLIDPIACAAHAVLRRVPRENERILVTGGGILAVGVLAAIRALQLPNHVTAIARHAFQADLLSRYGASDVRIHPRAWSHAERYDDLAAAADGRRIPARFGNQAFIGGFNVTYDCVGTGQSLTDAMKWTAARGAVVLVGTSQICVVDTTPLWLSELNIVGCNGRQIEEVAGRRTHTYEVVFDWLTAGRIDLRGLLTHRFPLADYRAAFDVLLRRSRSGVIKAAFVPD